MTTVPIHLGPYLPPWQLTPPPPERTELDEIEDLAELENDHALAGLKIGHGVEPETRLWRQVVVQAFQDARAQGLTKEQMVHVPRARAWLLTGSRDFVDVCLLADLEPERVTTVARNMAANRWA